MKVLVLSFFFKPDLSAGSFRNTALVNELSARLVYPSTVEVVSTLPSRYASFSPDAESTETYGNVKVHRIAVPKIQGGLFDQARAFIAYTRGVLLITKAEKYDLVYASSSRLMTAALGAFIAQKQVVPLYLDIRDLFVDVLRELYPHLIYRPIHWFFAFIEQWTFHRAMRVNLISNGFSDYFAEHYPKKTTSFFPNGIDPEFIHISKKNKIRKKLDRLKVVYAGNIGEGQGLDQIIPKLAKKLENIVCFTIVGDGSRKDVLLDQIKKSFCENVRVLAPVKRRELIDLYHDADVLFLHLNSMDAFLKVLPSKIFEYSATGKPIWAGVGGYAADFLKNEVENVAVFDPHDIEKAIKSFDELILESKPRANFIQKFSRQKIMKIMAADILSLSHPENK